jgi:hypothetical protein
MTKEDVMIVIATVFVVGTLLLTLFSTVDG